MAKKSLTKKVKKTSKKVGKKVAAGASAAGAKMKGAWGSIKSKLGKGKNEEE